MLRPFGVKLILLATVLYLVFFVGIQASARNIRLSNKSFFDLGHGAVPGDEPGHQGHRERRTATSADLSADEIADFLDKHNELRGQTVPQASNMKFMVITLIVSFLLINVVVTIYTRCCCYYYYTRLLYYTGPDDRAHHQTPSLVLSSPAEVSGGKTYLVSR